jgi:hypothetical protein
MLNACKAFLVVSGQGGRVTRADYSFTVKYFFFPLLVFGQFVSSDFWGWYGNLAACPGFLEFISSRVGSLCFCGLVFRPFEG